MSSHEPAEIRRHRDELLVGLSGRVLELGAGSNSAHYPPKVEQVMAVEPEPYLRHGLAPRRRAQTFQSRSLTALLTVCLPRIARLMPRWRVWSPAPCQTSATALTELRRVLRSGGELRLYERVRSNRPALALSQRAVDRVFWPRAFGGWHTSRDTLAAIAAAGFEVEQQRRMWVNPVLIAFAVASHAIGRARPR